MSVIAAKVYRDRIEIAADSIKVRWCTQQVNNSKLSKLWDVGPVVIGGVGSCQEVALMRLYSENYVPESESERGVLAFMAEFAEWMKKRADAAAKIENAYLMILGRHLFHIDGLFVEEVTSHEAIGAGMDFALASMHGGHSPEQAVATAIELSIWCAAPVKVITRKAA